MQIVFTEAIPGKLAFMTVVNGPVVKHEMLKDIPSQDTLDRLEADGHSVYTTTLASTLDDALREAATREIWYVNAPDGEEVPAKHRRPDPVTARFDALYTLAGSNGISEITAEALAEVGKSIPAKQRDDKKIISAPLHEVAQFVLDYITANHERLYNNDVANYHAYWGTTPQPYNPEEEEKGVEAKISTDTPQNPNIHQYMYCTVGEADLYELRHIFQMPLTALERDGRPTKKPQFDDISI